MGCHSRGVAIPGLIQALLRGGDRMEVMGHVWPFAHAFPQITCVVVPKSALATSSVHHLPVTEKTYPLLGSPQFRDPKSAEWKYGEFL